MQFEFATSGHILFGVGVIHKIGQLAADLGRVACVVSGLPSQVNQILLDTLNQSSVETILYPINGEPTIETINQGIEYARQNTVNIVIGLGGGSAIDTAKAIAIMLTNPGKLTDYLELVGKGQSITNPPLPIIAVPTTAGTGAEVTRNSVISVPEFASKVSLRSPFLLPRLALIDPELTYSLPPSLTATTGMDALTQLIEPFVCNKPNPITDGLCKEGIIRSASMLPRAYSDGTDVEARHELCVASLLGGLALANARLGAVHGIAGVLGGMLPIPHGAICARLLPPVMDINIKALLARSPDSPSLARYHEVARIITGDFQADAFDGVQHINDLCSSLQIQPLGRLGFDRLYFPDLIEKAQRSSSMKGNPLTLLNEEIAEILETAI